MYKKVPDKYRYNEMIEALEKAVRFYKNTDYKYGDKKLIFANKKTIEFSFREKNIAHLLGVDTFKLRTLGILSSEKSFDLLEELIRRSGYIYSKIERGEINFFDIFSEYTEEKIEVFETVLKFRLKDIKFASEYVKARAYINGEPNNLGCEYYISLKGEADQSIYLGFKKENDMFYAPASVLVANFQEENDKLLSSLIGNQEITMVNYLRCSNNGFQSYLRLNEKLSIVRELIVLDQKYGSITNIAAEYLYNASKDMREFDGKIEEEKFIKELKTAISKGSPLKASTIERSKALDEIYFQLAEAYNLSLKTGRRDISRDIQELAELRKKLTDAKKIIDAQGLELIEKDEQLEAQSEQIKTQQQELDRLHEFEEASMALVKKYCKTV